MDVGNFQDQQSFIRTDAQLCKQAALLKCSVTTSRLPTSRTLLPADRSTGPIPCRSAFVRKPAATRDCRKVGGNGRVTTSCRGAAIDHQRAACRSDLSNIRFAPFKYQPCSASTAAVERIPFQRVRDRSVCSICFAGGEV